MKDIVPELLEKIESDFAERVGKSDKLKQIRKLIDSGSATFAEANEYSIEVGKLLAETFKEQIGRASCRERV